MDKEMVVTLIRKNEDKIRDFGVTMLGLFGSFVHNEQMEDSDIDLLYHLKEEQSTLRNFMGLANFLEDLFDSKVDLVSQEFMSPYIRPYILAEVEYILTG